jgi:nucleotide-binding universal stress UspA family protein
MERKRSKGQRHNPQEYLQKTIGRIIVVLDDTSRKSEKALLYAAGLSRMCGASVIILCPMEVPLTYPAAPMEPGVVPILPARAWDQIEDQAEAALQEARITIANFGVRAEGKIIEVGGGISAAISRVTEDESDLILVTGSEAHGITRLFQKNTAAELVRHAMCPVLVVRD